MATDSAIVSSLFLGINRSVSTCSRLLRCNFSLRTKQYGLYLAGIFEMSPANRRVNEYCISPLADRRPTGQTAKLQWAGQALSADFHLPVRLAAWTGMSHATMPRWRLFLLLVRRRAECPTLEFHNEWISIAI